MFLCVVHTHMLRNVRRQSGHMEVPTVNPVKDKQSESSTIRFKDE